MSNEKSNLSNLNASYIMSKNMTSFILVGGESDLKRPKTIVMENLRIGSRARSLLCDSISEKESDEEVIKLLVDGNSFTIYFENNRFVIPATLLFFKNRPIQIEIVTKDIKEKERRAIRVPTKKTGTIHTVDDVIPITTEDVSLTGMSFWADFAFAKKGEKVALKNWSIEIVDRKKVGNKYFYRSRFLEKN